jgi:hypothetical protein
MKYELHPFCLAFRRANAQELATIVSDMQQHGYDSAQPITLYQDKILDGATRENASEMAGIWATYQQFTGNDDEAIAFVLRRNKARKHMHNGELDLAAARLVTAKRGHQPGQPSHNSKPNSESTHHLASEVKTCEMVAQISGRGAPTIKKARILLKNASPNVIAMIEAGAVTSATAYEGTIGMNKAEQEQLTADDLRKISSTNRAKRKTKTKSTRPAKPAPIRGAWRDIKFKNLNENDFGTERIPGQPVLLLPAYIQRLTEASIRVRGIAGRVEGCASMMLDVFDMDIKALLAHIPVKDKKNGEERNYAAETQKTIMLISKHIDAAIDKLSALRERALHEPAA